MLLVELEIRIATTEKSMDSPEKTKNRTNISPNNSIPWHIPRENQNSKIYINNNDHWNIIYSSQDM